MKINTIALLIILGTALFLQNLNAQNIWVQKSPLLMARGECAAVALNGFIYLAGGSDSNDDATDAFHRYSISGNMWTSLAPMPTPREELVLATVGGMIYAIGGGFDSTSLIANEAYNPGLNSWTVLTPMPTGRREANVAVWNNKIYVFGGIGTPTCHKRVEVYDPSTNTWTQKNDMPTERKYAAAGVINGKVYLLGGDDENSSPTSTCLEYDPVADSWTFVSSMPTAVHRAGSCTAQGKVFSISGNALGSTTGMVYQYDPAADTWSTLPPVIFPRESMAAVAYDDKLYAIGGYDAQDNVSVIMEMYDLPVGIENEQYLTGPDVFWMDQKLIIQNLAAHECQVSVFDLTGRLVVMKNLTDIQNSISLLLPSISEGIYFIQLVSDSKEHYKSRVLVY